MLAIYSSLFSMSFCVERLSVVYMCSPGLYVTYISTDAFSEIYATVAGTVLLHLSQKLLSVVYATTTSLAKQ